MKTRTDAEHTAKMKKIQAAQAKKVATKTVEKGLIIVHTGPGKGKTSAALGMAVRAIGHGMKVGVIQFVKGAMATGEKAVFDRFPDLIEFKPMGEGFTWDTQDRTRDIAVAREAWDEVKRMIADPSYAMVIADELNIVLRYDYLPVDEVLEALAAKPHMTHVIITGRNAPQELIDAADLVTEMAQVKHPFREQNVKAQRGIEF
ncbi:MULTISPECIES: cob(I)yrinic acid a,c-diamide adenosyltransferase [unclassified Sphingopyxis]|uniref:cob(I)yrinic acid a,c-diamide adenosyltransferase n=1 Tax=unclassified Sphingopyxis TaxID=2614943 RepID=UPI0007309ADF|nr:MULTISPECIES: cob(I)yrinic acid a,c-diamide adenosyltransferase [unclassified Sphingopyxis]KTE04561.1 cob(I)yrinic acid a,c-diamide adenosyltransferase [Sphingopyxis sp. H012]KTE13226.1 cob(I)yrinic acid a,c-diamide adenosyltransferase [Sphingopyxis sp. H053]KTE14415.1 cob(I)yrinic acid a,c-diamide adenosyltransferase [Sphingopyxis sp. H093]KTE31065.1 cob(I)yrinic acid a,c-diamide adenosyltransferase [Sphingopyxis sp. H080]KTE37060.1 cob(I)yrinic acid a,c-diamide adenosyltransferase [Sphing